MNTIEDLITAMTSSLDARCYKLDEDIYKRTFIVTSQGQDMIVNGRRYTQPGQQMPLEVLIDIRDRGVISNEDGSNPMEFIYVIITIYQQSTPVQRKSINIYYDEIDFFNRILDDISRQLV